MPTVTAPTLPKTPRAQNDQAIHLFNLGCLFVIRASYWPCRAGNEPAELNLTQDRIQRRAIASFGTKDLIDPEKGRKVFAQIEKKARHELAKLSQPFPAANAHFVPWDHVPKLIAQLDAIKAEFQGEAMKFLADFPKLKADWQAAHPDVPDAAYPSVSELHAKFHFSWQTFKVAGADAMTAIDVDGQLSEQHLAQMKQSLTAECQQFVAEYVMAFRREVANFCDHVVAAGGKVHGKTLQAIRRKIEHFHAMNIFADGQTATRLDQLKAQIAGVSGEDLAQQPKLAEKLSQACAVLKADVLDGAAVTALTGRLKRRVVLD